MLARGDRAPELQGSTTRGEPVRLSNLRGRPVVVYFFPKAGSLGCTRESREFARAYPEFRAQGVEIVGISVDSLEDQRRFQEECKLPFPLIADHEKEIARAYGVLGAFGFAKRVTFLLDPDGRVREVVDSILPGPHVRRARELLLGATDGGSSP